LFLFVHRFISWDNSYTFVMVHRVILFYKDLVFQALFQNPQQLYMGDFQWGSNQLRQPIFYQFQSNGTSLPVIIGPNV